MSNQCPDWAMKLILQLRQLEVQLGNIPDSKDWYHREDVSKLVDSLEQVDFVDDQMTELIFEKICRGLVKVGWETSAIVKLINSKIGYEGGPSYCNLEEVTTALQ